MTQLLAGPPKKDSLQARNGRPEKEPHELGEQQTAGNLDVSVQLESVYSRGVSASNDDTEHPTREETNVAQ